MLLSLSSFVCLTPCFKYIFILFRFRPETEINEYRDSKEITLIGEEVPKPVKSFSEAGFPEFILKELT